MSAKSFIRNFVSRMHAMDWYMLGMLVIYSALCLVFWSSIPNRWFIVCENLCIAILSLLVIHFLSGRSQTWIKVIREFYVLPFVYPMYAQTFLILPYVRSTLYDAQLESLDRWICGGNPTYMIDQWSSPLLTEYFQICYVAFFFLPSIHAIVLFKQQRWEEFEQFSRMIVFSFFVSYIAYFGFPAVGPRFTLHNFATMNSDLPGMWVTTFLRQSVNQGGGIVPGLAHPELLVNRDCMPSGHTMMTLVNIILAWKFRTSGKWFFSIVGSSLIVATLYLRYHYLVDIIAGIVCALLMFVIEPWVERRLHAARLVSAMDERFSKS